MILYPEKLPVLNHKEDIIEALRNHQVTIIAGDTGSGKTTQLPKFLLEICAEKTGGIIGCTQPRRVAAVSVSERVSEELGHLKNLVGYKIRFHDRTSQETRIKFMTDGVLLAETQQDPFFRKYDAIILDEAHERSLNIDFLLGYFKNILPKRPNLKLIITSATIDTKSFETHFPNSKIITIEGRTFPVEVRYSPLDEEQLFDKEGYIEHCVATIKNLYFTEPPGDILAFLPTERDIRTCCDLLNDKNIDAEILPMFGRLLPADQRKVFRQYKKTKIVIATNVAETSITVPGIRYVVDTGLARISSYNVRARTTSLPVAKISQASCDQRKGRCGRVAPGVCVRLYEEEDYRNRPRYTLPEIRRSNLAEVILRMLSLHLGDPQTFPFVDSPHSTAIRDGYKQLYELGAINSKSKLTYYGKLMARMPIDPCISRIIIESGKNNCQTEIRVIASALAIQDPRVRPATKEKEADAAHAQYSHPHSDFLALLSIWKHFHSLRKENKSWSRLKKFCKTNYLSFQRMREWFDLHEQMTRILKKGGHLHNNEEEASYEAIHRSLASGFLRNIATKKEKKLYITASGKEIMIFPGSHQFVKSGQWILAASFLETNRLYALTVATIEPEWLESIGGKLCKYSWDNPRWMKSKGQVIADEKVSLFGLPLLSGRQVNFGKRDTRNQRAAKKIFIQEALIEGRLKGSYPFLVHNLQLMRKWQETEERLRKRDILVDDLSLFNFYDERLPETVYDRNSLIRFLKKKRVNEFLYLCENDILIRRVDSHELLDYPTSWSVGSDRFKLEYNLAPGEDKDGITMHIPADLIDTISAERCEWLVPGLLKEKTTLLLKGLPKRIRKHLIPIGITVDKILDDIDIYNGSFYTAIERSILKQFKISVRRSDWTANLPNHLQMRFVLFNDNDTIIAEGRNLQELCKQTQKSPKGNTKGNATPTPSDQKIVDEWDEKLVSTWNFSSLPCRIELHTPQRNVAGFLYPSLKPVQQKGAVKVTFEQNKQKSLQQNIEGMIFLYRLQFSDQFKALKKACSTTLSGPSTFWLMQTYSNKKQAADALISFILHSIFPDCNGNIHDEKVFQENISKIKQKGLFTIGMESCDKFMTLLRKRQEVQSQILHFAKLSKKTKSFSKKRNDDYEYLLEEIFPKNYLQSRKIEDIEDCERYLRSLFIRVERAHHDYLKDEKKEKQIQHHLNNLQSVERSKGELSSECLEYLDIYKTMIQEFRISLFSPEIKTKISISTKKLQQQWEKIIYSK